MPDAQSRFPRVVTVVQAPACHFCEDAQTALLELAQHRALDLRWVAIDSPEGRALVSFHRPAMNPLVLVDGRFFSEGRLPRKKLMKLLDHGPAPRSDTATAGSQARHGL